MSELPVAVLFSGGGTTLQNLIDARARGALPIRIVKAIAGKHRIAGIERARGHGIPTETIVRREFASTEAYSERVFESCREAEAKLVCLAGFLQLLRIPTDFTNRVLNIHPSLLPAFGGRGMYGRHVHEAVLSLAPRCRAARYISPTMNSITAQSCSNAPCPC